MFASWDLVGIKNTPEETVVETVMCCPDPPLRKDLLLHLLGGGALLSPAFTCQPLLGLPELQ